MSPNQWADFWYYNNGVNTIPAHNLTKKPKVAWKEWQTVPIPDELFKEWKEKGMFEQGIAIVCGQVFRGENKGLWINGIDCDNKAGTEAMCPSGVEETAKRTLVEQHANPDKCHILFLTREPLKNRAINPNSEYQIEVKSMGKHLLYCSGCKHKDGSLIDIVGTETIQLEENKSGIENKLDSILGLSVKTTSAKVTDEQLSKLNTGDNRQDTIFRKLGQFFVDVPQEETTEEDCINKSNQLNSKLGTPYDQARAVTIGKDFYKMRMSDEPVKKKHGQSEEVTARYGILEKEPEKLRAITIDKDDNTFILVYLYSYKEENGIRDNDHHYGYFVKNGVDGKDIIKIDDKSLTEKYSVSKLFPEFELLAGRWKYSDIQSWLASDTKVNPKELFENLLKTERRYFENQYDSDYYFQACWTAHTYFYPLFDYTPYNDLVGMKGSGKSQRQDLLEWTCYNGMKSGDATVSSIFRTVQGTGGTIILDEAENLKGGKDDKLELESLLRNGFQKGGKVSRSKEQNKTFVPETFSVYSPKVVGHIHAVDNTLADRCIENAILKSTNKKVLEQSPDESKDSLIYQNRENLYRLFLDYAVEVRSLIPEARELIKKTAGRTMDLWTSQVTMALFFEKHGVENAVSKIKAKLKIISQNKQNADREESIEFKLIEILDQHVEEVPRYTKELYVFINEKIVELYSIEPLRPIDIKSALLRCGFHQGVHDNKAVPWIDITPSNILRQKERLGLVEPTQSTLGDTKSSNNNADSVDNVGSVA